MEHVFSFFYKGKNEMDDTHLNMIQIPSFMYIFPQ